MERHRGRLLHSWPASPNRLARFLSDSGSTVGAAARAQLRSGAVSMTMPRLVTWANTAHQGLCDAARQVVVLHVVGSNPIAHHR